MLVADVSFIRVSVRPIIERFLLNKSSMMPSNLVTSLMPLTLSVATDIVCEQSSKDSEDCEEANLAVVVWTNGEEGEGCTPELLLLLLLLLLLVSNWTKSEPGTERSIVGTKEESGVGEEISEASLRLPVLKSICCKFINK